MPHEINSDSESLVVTQGAPEASRAQQWKNVCCGAIDPILFGVFFAMSFSAVVTQTQIIDQTCYVIFGYNKTLCDQLGKPHPSEDTQIIEKTIQPYVSKIVMVLTLSGTIGPAISGIFFGAWSDKFGRKPLLFLSLTAFFFSYALWAFFSFLSTIIVFNPWFYVLTSIPPSLVGGYCSLLGATYCHIADTISERDRPLKLALLGAYVSISMFLGSLASGYVFEATNAFAVFAITAGLLLFIIVYLQLFVPESLDQEKLERSSKIKGLFQLGLVKEMISTLLKRRPHYDRMIIWMSIAILCASVFALEGSGTVFYLYVRKQFAWTAKDYTTYSAVSTLVGAAGSALALIVLQKVFKFTAISIILIGLGSLVLDNVIKTVAIYPWHLYLAVFIASAKGVALPSCRSLIATVTPPADIGKIYSITTALEFIVPISSAPLYTLVYNETLDYMPGLFNAITATIYLICYVVFSILFAMQVRHPSISNGAYRNYGTT